MIVRCLAILIAIPTAVLAAQSDRPVRTFPEFVGTWVLDEAASTGRLRMAPPPARTITIATTANDITVTQTLQLEPDTRGGGGVNGSGQIYVMQGPANLRQTYTYRRAARQ